MSLDWRDLPCSFAYFLPDGQTRTLRGDPTTSLDFNSVSDVFLSGDNIRYYGKLVQPPGTRRHPINGPEKAADSTRGAMCSCTGPFFSVPRASDFKPRPKRLEMHQRGYHEVLSFEFKGEAPDRLDRTTARGKLWRDFREVLFGNYIDGNLYLQYVQHVDEPGRVDLYAEWNSKYSRNAALRQPQLKLIKRDLSVYLTSDNQPFCSVGYPFRPPVTMQPARWTEVVDFKLAPGLTDPERQLFENFWLHFEEVTRHTSAGRQPLNAFSEGWVDPTTDDCDGLSPKLDSHIFRVSFRWDSKEAEKQWVRDFMSASWHLTGHRAFYLTLAATEGIDSHHMWVCTEWDSDLRGGKRSGKCKEQAPRTFKDRLAAHRERKCTEWLSRLDDEYEV